MKKIWTLNHSNLQVYQDKKHVATAHYAGNPVVDVSEALENARLIAAAPELLQALDDLIGMCNMPEVKQAMMKHNQAYYHTTMESANQASRKAHG